MEKRLTRKQALEKCRDMYRWLEEHRSFWKNDYLRAMDIYGDAVPECRCYACEYRDQHKSIRRRNYCGDRCIIPWSGEHCMSVGSEYDAFRHEKPGSAGAIAALCDAALAELPPLKGAKK